MRPRYVPMEVLGFDIERKRIGEQRVQCGGDFSHSLLGEIGRRVEGGGGRARFELSDFLLLKRDLAWL